MINMIETRKDISFILNDEDGYKLTKDVLQNKKAFCRIVSKPISGADHKDGEIEVLLTF